jgi:Ca2+-binding RTX toxin-like protein
LTFHFPEIFLQEAAMPIYTTSLSQPGAVINASAGSSIHVVAPNVVLETTGDSVVRVTAAYTTFTYAGHLVGSSLHFAMYINGANASDTRHTFLPGSSLSGGGILLADAGFTLVNQGALIGDDIGILSSGSAGNVILNSGMISTPLTSTAISLGSGSDLVRNYGDIHGRIFLGSGNDTLNGTDGQFIGEIDMGADDDLVILRGATVTDPVRGNVGNDTYAVDNPDLDLVENPGQGTDLIRAFVSWELDTNFDNLALRGPDAGFGIGNALHNDMRGNRSANVLEGRGGDDSLFGNGGNDALYGEWGNDSLTGGNGRDDIYGGVDNDVGVGGSGADTLRGGRGNDRMYGGDDDDRASGGLGNDTLDGGDDDDLLFGGRGEDRLSGGEGDDTVWAGVDALRDVIQFNLGDGRDAVNQFDQGVDDLFLSAQLWGGVALTKAQVIAQFATLSGGNIVFDFGNGDRLTILGATSADPLTLAGLANDFLIT